MAMSLVNTIHPMCENDVPAVAAIEALQHPVPWSAISFMDALHQGWHTRVLKDAQNRIRGYCVSMTAGDDEELLTITVHPDNVGQGLGRHLMQDLLSNARQRGAAQIFLEVRESNARAISLYGKMGFRMSGMRKNYYAVPANTKPTVTLNSQLTALAGREHALVMSLSLSGAGV